MFKRAMLVFALAGCGVTEVELQEAGQADDGVSAESGFALTVSSSDARAMLALVNAPTTTVALLDGEVGLDGRAAKNIVAARPFATVRELDLVSYVGDSALTKLRAYALAHPGSLAGTFDGVSFDEEQARAALQLANTATALELREAGLPATGAAPIVGNRPYVSLAQVAAVSGVGPATMKALLAAVAAPAFPPPAHPTGSGSIGKDEPCMSTAACQRGLMCAGETIFGVGYCRPQWMAGTFVTQTPIGIPDGDVSGVTSSIEVAGLATVPEDVVVHLDLVHPRKSDLRITLTQPSSAEAVVWAVDSNGDARVVMRDGVERDSMVNGTWTLKVIDTRSGESGYLRGWALALTSRWD